MQDKRRNALLAGATGLVGRSCLERLLASETYERVRVLVRRSVGTTHEKLEEHRVDFDALGSAEIGPVDDVFIAPDIAVEIVSPGQSVTDLLLRCLWYVSNGVRIALLIDPDRQSVVLFRPGSEPIALRDTGTLDLGDVIPEFSLDVADLFARDGVVEVGGQGIWRGTSGVRS